MVFYRSKEDPWLTRKRISLRRRSLPCHATDPPTALMYGNTRLYIDMAIYSLLGSSVVLIAEIVKYFYYNNVLYYSNFVAHIRFHC